MKRFARLGALLAMGCGMSWAAPVCVPGNLADYINLADGCTIGFARVSGFVDLGPLGPATGVTPDMVEVLPFGGPFSPGLQFFYGLSAGAGELLESRFSYILEAPVISAGLLGMLGSSVFGDGVNTVVEDFCHGQGFAGETCNSFVDTILVFDVGFDAQTSAKLDLPFLTMVGMIKDVVVDGGLTGAASLESVTNQFSLVPEPLTGPAAMLGLIACGALGILRRRPRGEAR